MGERESEQKYGNIHSPIRTPKEKKKVTLKMKKNCGGVLNIEDTPH